MVISKDLLIENSRSRMQESLKVNPDFNISLETQQILEKFMGFKTNIEILNIDLVVSTRMSLDLPMDKLPTITRSFAQEMSAIITNYSGYVLKFVGDSVLAFFIPEDMTSKNKNSTIEMESNDDGSSFHYDNAVECARVMLEVIGKSMNPVLTEHGFPELKVRIGMYFGKVAIVKYGIDVDESSEKTIVKRIHLDMIGYTISLAVKMTSLARPDHMVIGQSLFDKLDKKQKEAFVQQPTEQDI